MRELQLNPILKNFKIKYRFKEILGIIFLIIFALGLYLPYIELKEFQGEEGRRALVALQMLETRNFLIPNILGEPYFNKPPLFYWLLALVFSITNNCSEFVARSVSTVMALSGAVFLTFIWKNILKNSNIKYSFWSLLIPGLIFLTVPEVIDKAIRAEIDQTYTFIITVSLFSWFYFYEIKNKKNLGFIISGLFLGLGILSKTFQALSFFYLAIVPYFLFQKRWKELLSLPHLLGIVTYLLVFLLWAIPVNFQIGFIPFLKAWISEYQTAATTAEVPLIDHLSSFTIGVVIGYAPWIFFLIFYKHKEFKKFLNQYPSLKKIALFSFCLFAFSYFFYFIFIGSRLRYILPSAGGFVFLTCLPVFYCFIHSHSFWKSRFFKTFYYGIIGFLVLSCCILTIYLMVAKPLQHIPVFLIFNLFCLFIFSLIFFISSRRKSSFTLIFAFLIVAVFFVKQIYTSFYYPYHQAHLNHFRNASVEIGNIITSDQKKDNSLYICKKIPHHIVYYLKYRFHIIENIIYSKYCDESYFKDWMLVPAAYQLFHINTENYKVYQLKIRKKAYLLIKKQGNSS